MHLGRLPTEKLRLAYATYTCVCRGTTLSFRFQNGIKVTSSKAQLKRLYDL
jgi:hypothetical protein